MTVLEYTGKTVNEALANALNDLRLRKDDVDITVLSEGSKGFLGIGAKEARIRVRRKDGQAFDQAPPAKPAAQPARPAQAPKDAQAAPEKAPAPAQPTAAPAPAKPAKDNGTEISIIELSDEDPAERPQADTPTEATPAEAIPAEARSTADHDNDANAEDIGLQYLAPIFAKLNVQPIVRYSETDEEIRFEIEGDDVGILIGRRGETLNALQFLLSLVINRRMKEHKRIILDCENYRSRRADTLDRLALRMASKAKDTGRRVSLEPMSAAERRLVHLALEGVDGIKVESIGEEPNRRIVIYPNNR